MGGIEKIITVVIIFFFLFLMISLRFENSVEVYDCSKLYKYNSVPSQILEECFNRYKPATVIRT
jgi:hypothetical protein